MGNIHSITILGAGHCGRQIAHCTASAGIRTTCFEKTPIDLERSRSRYFQSNFPDLAVGSTQSQTDEPLSTNYSPIRWTSELKEAADCDVLLESVNESLPCKRDALKPFASLCRSSTLLVTNSSYYLPSSVFQGMPHPERFASMHFHVPPWFARAVDIMPTNRTTDETMETLVEFVREIGLTPIRLRKEYPGYIFNSLLHPLLVKSLELADRDLCSPETVDLAWKEVTGMPTGPFGMMLEIGLPTLKTIVDRAAIVMGDDSTIRAQRFLHGWSGDLQPQAISQSKNRSRNEQYVGRRLMIVSPDVRRSRKDLDNLIGFGEAVSVPVPPQKNSSRIFSPFKVAWSPIPLSINQSLKIDSSGNRPFRIRFSVRGQSLFENTIEQQLNRYFSYGLNEEKWDHEVVVLIAAKNRNSPTSEETSVKAPFPSQNYIEFIERIKNELSGWNDATIPKSLLVLVPLNELGHRNLSGWGIDSLIRSLWLESFPLQQGPQPELNVRSLELDIESPSTIDQLIEAIELWRPILGHSTDNEASFSMLNLRHSRGVWCRPVLRKQTIEKQNHSSLDTMLRGSVWMISGGGRGITARMCSELGRFGARVHLLGRTQRSKEDWWALTAEEIAERKRKVCKDAVRDGQSLSDVASRFDSQVELSQNLHLLEEQKIDFHYHIADVSKIEDVRRVKCDIEKHHGMIDGFLHGAGFEQTVRLPRKTSRSISMTIESKVQGAWNLGDCINRHTRWFIHCGSLSGFFGGVGQVDYSAANGFLANHTESLAYRWPQLQALTIAWPGWQSVGMAARKSSEWSLRRSGHELMSVSEGIQHFLDALTENERGHLLLIHHEEIPNILLDSGESQVERINDV